MKDFSDRQSTNNIPFKGISQVFLKSKRGPLNLELRYLLERYFLISSAADGGAEFSLFLMRAETAGNPG